jgi:hypothetical protein
LKWMWNRTIVIKFLVPTQHILGAIWQNQNKTCPEWTVLDAGFQNHCYQIRLQSSCAKVLFKIYLPVFPRAIVNCSLSYFTQQYSDMPKTNDYVTTFLRRSLQLNSLS